MTAATSATRAIEHEIKTPAGPERVMTAITHVDELAAWYGPTADVEDRVGFDLGDHPSFRWAIQKDDARITWRCVAGPGRSVGTTAIYDVVPSPDGRTIVRLTHLGWEDDDDAFRRCNTYWGALMHQLERYLQTGEHRPVFA